MVYVNLSLVNRRMKFTSVFTRESHLPLNRNCLRKKFLLNLFWRFKTSQSTLFWQFYSFQINFAVFFFFFFLWQVSGPYWVKTFNIFLRYASILVLTFYVNYRIWLFQHLYVRNLYRYINNCILLKTYYIHLILSRNCSRRNSRNSFLRLEHFKKQKSEIIFRNNFFHKTFFP